MSKCKYCDSEDFYEEQRGPHIGIYCIKCTRWQSWKKQNNFPEKTNEDYKREYLEGQDATPEQESCIRMLLRKGLSKHQAMFIIGFLTANEDKE